MGRKKNPTRTAEAKTSPTASPSPSSHASSGHGNSTPNEASYDQDFPAMGATVEGQSQAKKQQSEGQATTETSTSTPSRVEERSVLADAFVPRRVSIVNEMPVSVVLSALPSALEDDNTFFALRRDVAPFVPKCHCGKHNNYVPQRYQPELYWAVEKRKRELHYANMKIVNPHPPRPAPLPLVDNIADIQDYVTTFRKLLRAEREEELLLYERYSQYGQSIVPIIGNLEASSRTRLNSFTSKVPGISDCSPPLQPGDFVLLRPTQALMLPQTPRHPNWPLHKVPQWVEVQALLTQAWRHFGGQIQATWLDYENNRFLHSHLQSKKYHIRFVPSGKQYERSLNALDWLANTISNKTIAMDLLFPSKAPVLPPEAGTNSLVAPFVTSNSEGVASAPTKEMTELFLEQRQLNDKQSAFVRMVMRRTLYPEYQTVRGPMVLTGPAGTGKTKALLCAIRQVVALNDSPFITPTGSALGDPTRLDGKEADNGTKRRQEFRILVCTPSHTAADVITRRLAKHLDHTQLFRLYDSDRPVATVPIELLRYCRQKTDSDVFTLPPAPELMNFQVIVSTCTDASLLYRAGLTNQQLRERRVCFKRYLDKTLPGCGLEAEVQGVNDPHFTHFFLDEAAQATEPESLIPLSVVVDPMPNSRKVEIALCGDPRQLSPAVYCPKAAEAGLDRSWMERILQRPVTCLGGGHDHMLGPQPVRMEEWLRYSFQQSDGQEQLSIFLTTNYRGHASFLALPSALFYFDKLQSADFDRPTDADGAIDWCEKLRWVESLSEPIQPMEPGDDRIPEEALTQKQFTWPIHFRGVVGKDVSTTIESFATNSWQNKEEAEAVVEIVQTLAQKGVSTQSIGVMAPFRGQVVLIRNLLRAKNLGGVDVGTVENYQAVERDVIVLSLTRSSSSFTENDKEKRVGLFGQRKRSNVALTRAENMFIVVGNPSLMAEDSVWREFLWFTLRNGLWYGAATDDPSVFQWTPDHKVVRCHRSSNRSGLSVGPRRPQEDVDPSIVTIGTLERLLRSTDS